MTTKAIAVLIIALVLYGAWNLFLYWDKVKQEKETAQKDAAASVVTGGSLSGLPGQFEQSLHEAEQRGAAGMTNWLKTYGQMVADPRKAWIELDYVVLLARDNPAEAKRLFAAIKERIPPSSPVWPRINQLAKTYQ
jgi:hypothetical protein